MKRIISLALCIMLVFSLTAFADDYDALFELNNNYSAQATFTMNAGGAVKLLDTVAELYEIDKYVDMSTLVQSLADSTANGKIALDAQNDFKTMKASYEFTFKIPTQINSNLSFESTGKYGMWLDMDITDEMHPKMNIIYQSPVMSKYVVLDVVKIMQDNGQSVPEVVSYMQNYLSEEHLKSVTEKCKEALRNNSSITIGARKSSITVSSEQMKDYIEETFNIIKEETENNEEYSLLEENIGAEFWEDLHDMLFDIIDDTDMTLTFDLEKDKYDRVFKMKADYKIAFDLADVFDEVDFGTADTKMSLSFVSDIVYDRNMRAVVTMPALNESNSMSFEDFFEPYYGDYYWHNFYIECEYVPSDNKSLYVDLNKFTKKLKKYGYQYEVDKTSTGLTLTETTGNDRFATAQFVFGSNEITVDGVSYSVSNPPIDKDGTVFVDTDALKYVFNMDLNFYELNILDGRNTANVSFERRNPNYEEEDYEDDYEDEEMYQCVYVEMEFRNASDAAYNPLRDVLYELEFYGITYDVAYDNGVVTLQCTSGNDMFTTAIFTVGSADIIVDGETITCPNPTIEIDDKLYIDDQAVKAVFGLEYTYGGIYYDNYDMKMQMHKSYDRTMK